MLTVHAGFDLISSIAIPSTELPTVDALLTSEVESLSPTRIGRRDRAATSFVPNPFLGSAKNRHPTLEGRKLPRLPRNGVVDGYIKIRLSTRQGEEGGSAHDGNSQGHPRRGRMQISPGGGSLQDRIVLLPPNFSTGMSLGETERRLWYFREHP